MSKVYIKYEEYKFPPLLKMIIHGAIHYRQDRATFQRYRESINTAANVACILYPIDYPIDVEVVFIDPTSPDIANCIMALYRAMDGKALKGKSLLTDDGLISKVSAMKFYPSERGRAENRVP